MEEKSVKRGGQRQKVIEKFKQRRMKNLIKYLNVGIAILCV